VATIWTRITDRFKPAQPKTKHLPPHPGAIAPGPRGHHLEYSPKVDGQADPGEIVWTWVEFEEDASQGKDRPVLVVGRDGKMLLGLMLSGESTGRAGCGWIECSMSTRTRFAVRARS